MPQSNPAKLLITAASVGLVVGIVFIFVQPLFGMSALTQRHADAYVQLGSMNPDTALMLAWCVHLFVSACYGIAAATALLISRNAIPFAMQIVFLSWLTTVIAPPANGLIIKLVASKTWPAPEQLPALNFQFDAKLILHVLFFAAIAITLWVNDRRR